MMPNFIDLTGMNFGRLRVLWPCGKSKKQVYWSCQCDCGHVRHIAANKLRSGNTKSCGCFRRQFGAEIGRTNVTHGHSVDKGYVGVSATYRSYMSAKSRCNNPQSTNFEYWGGRGIQFKFNSLQELIDDIGLRPPNHTLDRVDNNGNYERGNVRWATRKEQANNRRLPWQS